MTTELQEQLVEAARATILLRYRADWHVVASALRLRSGEVITGVHLEANVGRIAVCAEAVALGRAVTEFGSSAIEMIVAVRRAEDDTISVVTPCGMCREMISDYAPGAIVLVPGPSDAIASVPIEQLLPNKYSRGD